MTYDQHVIQYMNREIQKLYTMQWRMSNPDRWKESKRRSNRSYYQRNKERLNKRRIENLRRSKV